MIYTATVTSKRQITLPIKLFADFGIEPGDKLTMIAYDDGILMKRQVDLVNKLAGSVKLPVKYQGMEIEKIIHQAKESYWQEKSREESR